uniref:WxcM-like domain-containing protein n=1 Tax=Rodentolepis nana TaxID=102285 RepID=A0A0R3T7V6_RODNA
LERYSQFVIFDDECSLTEDVSFELCLDFNELASRYRRLLK